MINKEDMKAIDKAIKTERESGHLFLDIDDYDHDIREIAEMIGVSYEMNDDYEIEFKSEEDEQRCKDGLQYYLEKH